MTDGLEKLFRWTFKYGRYIIAYVTAAVIAITTAFLVSYYVYLYR